MCGRMACSLHPRKIARIAGGSKFRGLRRYRLKYNLSPKCSAPILYSSSHNNNNAASSCQQLTHNGSCSSTNKVEQSVEVCFASWGLASSRVELSKYSTINARVESLHSSPVYRYLINTRRCVVLCDGFYEWKKEGQKKRPFFIRHLFDEDLLARDATPANSSKQQSAVQFFSLVGGLTAAAATPAAGVAKRRQPTEDSEKIKKSKTVKTEENETNETPNDESANNNDNGTNNEAVCSSSDATAVPPRENSDELCEDWRGEYTAVLQDQQMPLLLAGLYDVTPNGDGRNGHVKKNDVKNGDVKDGDVKNGDVKDGNVKTNSPKLIGRHNKQAPCQPTAAGGGDCGNLFHSFTVVTMDSTDTSVAPIHDRMPLLLNQETATAWLDGGLPYESIVKAAMNKSREIASQSLLLYEVSPMVGNVRNNRSACVRPMSTRPQPCWFTPANRGE
eukprot:GHVS01055835.1.p1 GENE.GHVS01055835.1~~GHVS01055835.1.p1  ORF type:complete len:447 (-),score=104.62 GHVS01055835.1:169-1509(-)